MEELFDTFDKDGNFLGVKPRSYCHSEGVDCYHKTVWIWIINDEKKVLVQRRAAKKSYMPLKWDMPSAGHVPSGETILSACIRETQEELGLTFQESDFIFQTEFRSAVLHEFGQVYLLRANFSIEETSLQQEEVAEIKWLSLEEFIPLLYSAEFVPHDLAYKDYVVQMLKENL